MMYPYVSGGGSLAFQGMSVFLGVPVSLGASSVVSQFTSGLVLMYSRAVRPGEYVRFGEIEGTVMSLGFLSTKIRTKKNEEIHAPNSVLLGTTVKNYSRIAVNQKVILYTSVTIGYNTPWRQVRAALSDFYVEYQLNAYLDHPDERMAVLSRLHENIQDLFNEYGVQIMSPHYEMDPAHPVVVPKAIWYASPARSPENET